MKIFNAIIEEICIEQNIDYKLLSKDWIYMLEKNNVIRFIAGYKFDLNKQGLGQVLDDKYALYEVLKNKNIKVVTHQIIFKNYDKDEILRLFKEYNKDVVVKVNTGTCGNGMSHIKDEGILFTTIDRLLEKNFSISICPFYNIKTEYRIIMLNDNPELVYGKRRPIVVGDGYKTVEQLLIDFNRAYYGNWRHLNNEIYKSDYIPNEGEIIDYNWQFNLSKGSMSFIIKEEKLKRELVSFAHKVSNELGLTFGSVDIIETQNELLVLEVNSGVMMDNFIIQHVNGYDIAKGIYRKAIEELFK